jgi:hypothetical protein
MKFMTKKVATAVRALPPPSEDHFSDFYFPFRPQAIFLVSKK